MEFLCYHRDRPESRAVRDELRERHWDYMDGFADAMIARGPTLGVDGIATGSVHVLDLPDVAAARAFAFDEPGYQAGVYRDVLLRRWRNLLGRTMWDDPQLAEERDRYLVLGYAHRPAADVIDPPAAEGLLVYGPLLSDDGTLLLGAAAILAADDPDQARAVLSPARYDGIEVHRWQPGGRPAGG